METTITTAAPMVAIKNLGYVLVFVASTSWLGFEPQSVGIFMGLMTLDIIFGTVRAGIVDGPQRIRSAIFSKGIIAKLMLLGVPIACALALRGIGFNTTPLAQGIINILILSETYSILGNIHSVITRKPKNEFDAVAYILSFIKTLLDKTVRDNTLT